MNSKIYYILICLVFFGNIIIAKDKKQAIQSFEMGHTISKVRLANHLGSKYIVSSSFEGTLQGLDFEGQILWEQKLSGFYNHDISTVDIDNDGIDEVLAANANGTIYCVDSKGILKWELKLGKTPVYTISSISKKKETYVVCGAMDKNMYYVSSKGKLIKTIPSNTYSLERSWGKAYQKPKPESKQHITNFIRSGVYNKRPIIIVHAAIHSTAAEGSLYLFDVLENLPFKIINIDPNTGPIGDLKVSDINHDGYSEVLLGRSGMIQDAKTILIDFKKTEASKKLIYKSLSNIDRFGYRVSQSVFVKEGQKNKILSLFGSRIVITSLKLAIDKSKVIESKFAFNDMCYDKVTNRLILASAQSGGSQIHILDLNNKKWQLAYEQLKPSGKIGKIISFSENVKELLKHFKRPIHERTPKKVIFMTESRKAPWISSKINEIHKKYDSPTFLNTTWRGTREIWDRTKLISPGNRYITSRDSRMNYGATSIEAAAQYAFLYEGNSQGASFWGGHGTDPMFYSLSTYDKILNNASKKPTVFIFPELEDTHDYFEEVLENYFFPLAEKAQNYNSKISLRNKHAFWYGNVYLPMWKPIFSGKYKDVFIPSMEETSDKTMEITIAARMGLWASGVFDDWGVRCARDNASYDRLRQYSHQMLPNHFLRTQIYNIASGASYINNFSFRQDYMSIIWDLIAKGALYVPNKEELLSINPVHLSINNPDPSFIDEGNNVKWLTFYDQKEEEKTSKVFGRLNGTWPAAPNNTWDFSNYAAKEKERRLNFLPKYNDGLVLITPLQSTLGSGLSLKNKLHPIYKNILKEFVTDGVSYYDKNTNKKYPAKEYYKIIEKAIEKGSKKIPLTVNGEVAWVTAQTNSTHLRLTIVDNGYINPSEKIFTIKYNTIDPIKITDILSGEVINNKGMQEQTLKVSCGGFRFFDIEFEHPLLEKKDHLNYNLK